MLHKEQDFLFQETPTNPQNFNRLIQGRDGLFLYNYHDIYVGQALQSYGEYNQAESQFLQNLLLAGDTVLEIGANIGSHTVGLAKKVTNTGKVIAIEPQQVIFQNLCANIALNSLVNVETIHAAMGSEKSWITLPDFDYSQAGNFGGISVQNWKQGKPVALISLDSMMSDGLLDISGTENKTIRMVKIDVEGMETSVLKGGKNFFSQYRPVLYVENNPYPEAVCQELIETIWAMDYIAFWHFPALYTENNYFGAKPNPQDVGIVSCNMVCIDRTQLENYLKNYQQLPNCLQGLMKITDATHHPIRK